jgi:L-alanine-DL-glutamate epimerase-like enolase superfamily enzyme
MHSLMCRRDFMKTTALLGTMPSLASVSAMAATQRGKVKITDIKTMILQGPRTYTLVKVLTDSGFNGIGEAYGSPGAGIRDGIESMRQAFIGKDPLDINAWYYGLGNRMDGSAHQQLRAVTGVDVAVYDLVGKILNVPAATLLGGPVRSRMRMYTGQGPQNMLDKAACKEWAARVKESPAGWTGFKLGAPRAASEAGRGRGGAAPVAPAGPPPIERGDGNVSNAQLNAIRQGFENCREALGWDYDLMFHGGWDYDLFSSIAIAEALVPARVAWLEDPLPPNFSESWVHLTAASKVPILTGENLGRHEDWELFFSKKGFHIGQLDLRNVGGLNEAKKISDMADLAMMPMCAHNTGCIINNFATLQWAVTVKNFIACETRIGNGDWMDDVIIHDGPVVKNGHITLPDKPGLGIELNPDVVKAHLAKGETWWGD